MAVVRNRSGLDAGMIDYTLKVERFEDLSKGDLKDTLETLRVLSEKVEARLKEIEN